jgi:FemAB family protein
MLPDRSLVSARLFLRSLETTDATPRYVDWLNDPDINQYLESRHKSNTIEDVRQFIVDNNESSKYVLFGIFKRDDGHHIGNLRIGPMDSNHQTAWVGIMIGEKSCFGRGFASEAILAASRYCQESLGLTKLLAGIYETNLSSVGAFRRAGFQLEARHISQAAIDADRIDTLTLGLLLGAIPANAGSRKEAITNAIAQWPRHPVEIRLSNAMSSALDRCFTNLPWQFVDWQPSTIRYQAEYLKSTHDLFLDLSVEVWAEGEPVGFWPVFLVQRAPTASRLLSNGAHLIEPAICAQGRAIQGRIAGACLDYLRCAHDRFDIPRSDIALLTTPSSLEPSTFGMRLLEEGGITSTTWQVGIDLEMPEATYWRHVRASYRSLMRHGRKRVATTLIQGTDPQITLDAFEEFRVLHRREAGRETRGRETWQMQARAVMNGDAFVVMQRDEQGELVGGSLFHVTRDEAYYAVAAYRRDLFHLPLGHTAQVSAIEVLRRRGVRWYRIGARPFPGDSVLSSRKEQSIGFFKQGFASRMQPSIVVSIR